MEAEVIDSKLYTKVDDPRGFFEEYPDPRQWRIALRKRLHVKRNAVSDLTRLPILNGFDLHEGLFQRHWVPKDHWQHFLFSGPNVFLLRREEHIPNPPSREICYWLSVCRYSSYMVNQWINSLPWKVPPDQPWRGTHGLSIIAEIPEHYRVHRDWYKWFESSKKLLDCEA